MKSLRVWLLVLLAVLLPIRGALAAAMLCPDPGAAVPAQVQSVHEGVHDHGQVHGAGHGEDATHAHANDSGEPDDHFAAGGTADNCNLCSAFCSVTAVVDGSISIAEPQKVSTVFPHLYAPPPSFIPDGQERPPRTI